jgi:hypothetical protein
MRLGDKRPPAPPASAGRKLFEVLGDELARLDLGDQMGVGGALSDRTAWDELDERYQRLFERAAELARR